MNKLRAMAIATAICTLGTSGCVPFWLFEDDDDDPPPQARPSDPPPPQPTPTPSDTNPPLIVEVHVPEWPPLGMYGLIDVTVTDDTELSRLEARLGIQPSVSIPLFGPSTFTQITGSQLGDGFATLSLKAFDQAGWSDTRDIHDVVVDLTAPEITLGSTSIRPEDTLEIWAADNYVLGTIELTVENVFLFHDFPEGYPDTLGSAWDYTVVAFAGADLPLGTSDATVLLYDAAGNYSMESFTLTVEAEAPPTP